MTSGAGDSFERIVRVARALGPLSARVVLIGGSLAPILHTDPQLPRPRPTHDVDGVLDAPTYTALGDLQAELRATGFKEEPLAGHAHRWHSPDNDIVDLVPPQELVGGSGQLWDQLAIEFFEERELVPGAHPPCWRPALSRHEVRGLPGSGRRRSVVQPRPPDVIALAACRPSIVDEVAASDSRILEFVRSEARRLAENALFEDFLAADLNNAHDVVTAMSLAATRLRAMATL
ncbi:MAG: hypothetical protein ACT4OZ_10940 [Gemmatimonadota bacterium]